MLLVVYPGLPAYDLHHAVKVAVLQVPLLSELLVGLSLGDTLWPHTVTSHADIQGQGTPTHEKQISTNNDSQLLIRDGVK